jgi:hypothetical protein
MKKYFKRGILGFCLGITVSIIISLVVSLVLGDGTFHYVSSKLLLYTNNELIAAIVQVILSGTVGLVISISMLCFEVEKWSLLQQSIIHFIIMIVLMVAIFLLTSLSFSTYLVILILLYFVIWNIQYLVYKYKVKEINKALKKINGKNDSINKSYEQKSDKSLLILLMTYLIVIAIFFIYDFLEINLSVYLKYIALFITCIVMMVENVKVMKSKNDGSSISKVISPVVSISLLALVLVINHSGFIAICKEYTIPSTNLSEVFIDGLTVGDSLEKFDDTKYTATNRYTDDNYNFISKEIMISEKNNKINKIYGRVGKVDININGDKASRDLADVVSRLGNDYVKTSFDNEQLLKQYIYVDKINDIKVSFVYRDYTYGESNNNLEYVIISKS